MVVGIFKFIVERLVMVIVTTIKIKNDSSNNNKILELREVIFSASLTLAVI